MKKSFLLLLIAFATLQLNATTYYCSPNGTGTGTKNNPGSFATGLSKMQLPGDTLYLLPGQYDLLKTGFSNSGSSSKYIVISGTNGTNALGSYDAILDFRNTPYGDRGLMISGNYVHVRNLTLRYSGKNNLYNTGSYNLFENLDIYGSADTGCQMKNGGDNTIKNVDSHHNFDYEHYNDTGAADFGGNADGFADKQFTGNGNHYIGCRSWCNSDDGWDFYQRISTSETIIEHCVCYQNGPATFDMRNHARYTTDRVWFDSIEGTTITNRYGDEQIVTLAQYPNHGNGNGFKLGGGNTAHNALVHHCLSVENTVKGFDQNSDAGALRLYNNTAMRNSSDYAFYNNNGCTLDIENCISFETKTANSFNSSIVQTSKNNSWNTGFSVSASDFQSTDTTLILSPRQSDGELAETIFMRLSSGSKLIDAGVDVSLPFAGDAPDLGCYETDGRQHPSLVCTTNNASQSVMEGSNIAQIVVTWEGAATGINYSTLPAGIMAITNQSSQTLTFTGAPTQAGTYTIVVTTLNPDDVSSVSLTIQLIVKSQNAHRVAYVTTPNSAEDTKILNKLNGDDDIAVTIVDASSTNVDYSGYELIIIGPKPSSSAAGFTELKGYDKPMLVLKPFLFKSTVWNYATPANTADQSIQIIDTTHPLFNGLTVAADNTLQVFSGVNTNAVTAVSDDWSSRTDIVRLASPISYNSYTTIAWMPASTTLNQTTLTKPLLMIGLSEYSTALLNDNGLQLVQNGVYQLLGITPTATDNTTTSSQATKIITPQGLIIRHGDKYYTITGQSVHGNF